MAKKKEGRKIADPGRARPKVLFRRGMTTF